MTDKILNFLNKDKINHINMINFIENYPIFYQERIGNSIIIKGVSDRKWIYISSQSPKELNIIKNKLKPHDTCFAIIENWMIPILTEGYKIKWMLSTMRLILTQNRIESPSYHTSHLNNKDADFIYENSDYKDFVSIQYIKERIKNGVSSCIHINHRPVAWAITQDDGAIGFLHVLPQFRGQGFGRAITQDMINKVRRLKKIPFVHIEESNKKSIRLALSLGFKKDKIVNWFEIDRL